MRSTKATLEILGLTFASVVVLVEATVEFSPTSAQLSAARVDTYYGLLAGGFALVVAALAEWRFLQIREKIEDLQQSLSGPPPEVVPWMFEGRNSREWLFTILGVALVVEGGVAIIIAYPLNQKFLLDPGLGSVAIGIGLLALAESWVTSRQADTLLKEIRRAEVEEKVAMMHGYGGSLAAKIVSDLRALESVAISITDEQATTIQSEGRRIVTVVLVGCSPEAEQAREILNRILASRHMTI